MSMAAARRVRILIAEDVRYTYPTIKLIADELVRAGTDVDLFSRCGAHREETAGEHRFRPTGYVPLWDHHGKWGKIEFLARGLAQGGRHAAYVGACDLGIILARLLARRHGSVCAAYVPELFAVSSRFERWADACARRADALIDVDPRRLEHRRRHGSLPAATFCIPNVPSLGELGDLPGATPRSGMPVLWYHGSLSPNHGIGEILEGYRRCRAEIELHLTGPCAPCYQSELRSRIARLGKPVLLHEPAPRRLVLTRARQQAHVAVCFYPFRQAPHDIGLRFANPAKLFDYMALGIPTIASDNPSLVSLVEKQGWGVCVPPEDPAAVAEAIDRLMGDAPLRARMSIRARELFLSEYHLEKAALPFIGWLRDRLA
ncbi:MAG: glycosyltransferase [Armatimonadetes bacterium]|nr:glycosyltransferase [Armatimonadota bacterium]